MGKDRDPWHLRNFNYGSNVGASALAKQSTNSIVFPNYADPYGLFGLNWTWMPPSHPGGFASSQKRFMVFDHSKNQTNLIYNSVGYPTSSALDLPASNETNVSNGNVNEEEMHEDTEEIDALLYSDSDSYEEEEEEEEASTGHSPIPMPIGNFDNEEDVAATASSAVLPLPAKKRSAVLPLPAKKRSAVLPLPAKKCRIESTLDPSLTDTASSTNCDNEGRKKSKREKIQDTVRVLRQILPDSKGNDAASVLDEAIQYLRSLRLKAKVLGVATTSNLKQPSLYPSESSIDY